MRKKMLSLALALAMCLGLMVPVFAEEESNPWWKLDVPGKSDAEALLGDKTFILRDCGYFDLDFRIMDTAFFKDEDRQWSSKNVRVLEKGDTAVLTYTPVVYTGTGGFSGGGIGTASFHLIAWSDPDGDGVYDKRLIKYRDDEDFGFLEGKNGYCELLSEDLEVLPAGIDISGGGLGAYGYGSDLDYAVNPYEVGDDYDFDKLRLSADRVTELFGPNTLIWIARSYISNTADWFIYVEGDTARPAVPTVGNFSDVKTDDYFAEPVAWAVEKNITQGTGSGQFSPSDTCNQGQILTFLWRAQGEPAPSGTVSGTQYYAAAAQWAKEQGLTGNFSAEADCTRAMVVTYLWKLAGGPNTGTSDFTDVPADADYAQAVAWAVAQGITSGTGAATFSPDAACTRGQIAAFLYRAFAK